MSNKKFNARHGVSVGTTPVDVIDDTGAVLTNAATATKLLNSRTISISGDVVATGSFDGSGNLDLAATIQANSVALGTDTTGNYMVDVSAGTGVSVSHTPGEGSTATVSIGQAVATTDNVTFNNLTLTGELRGPATFVIDPSAVGDNTGKVVIKGDLQVDGTTTTINSTSTTIDDVVLTLGGDTAPTTDDTFDKGIEYRWYDTQARLGFFGFDRSTGKLTFIPQSTLSSGVYSGTTGEIDAKLDWSNVLNKPTIDNTTYNHLAVTTSGGALLRLNSSGGANDDVKFASGTNTTVVYTNDDTITISSSNHTYAIKASTQTGGAGIDLDAGGSGSGTDTVKVLGSGGTSVAYTDADTITISSTSVGDGTLSIAAKSAGLTNTDVTLSLSGAYSANSSANRTINAVVGPAISALATFMTTSTAGFIRRTGQDTYGIDTNTYLTGNQSISLTGDTTGSGSTSIATTTNYISGSDDRVKAPNDDTANKMRFGFTSWGNDNSSPYADYLHLRSYTDATGGNDNLVMFRKDAIGMRIWQQAWNSTTAYSTYKDVAFTDQIPTVNNGALSIAAKSAGATNTDVTLELSGAYSANTSTDRTIKAVVGPALTALATLMTTAGAGFIRRTGQDTYGIDTNTYLTSYSENSTLSDVTGRGATTSTATTFNGGITVKDSISASTTIAGANFNLFSNLTGFQSLTIAGGNLITGTDKYVYIGTGTNHVSSTTTVEISSATAGSYVQLNGIVKFPNVGTSGFVKLGAGGQLSADTNTYALSSHTHSYLPLSGGTLTGKVVFPSTIADRPQFPGGILALDTGDANADIWGISREYYPSHATAANQWGIKWDAESNQVRFVGGGTDRLVIDLDGGTAGLTWDGNTVWNAGNDGASSGLDADLLDGNHASAFALSNHAHSYLPLSGGTLTGDITYSSTGLGLQWIMNTDSAYIKFYNTGNGDTDSRLEYGTSDDNNEYHRWMVSGNEKMNLKNDALNVTVGKISVGSTATYMTRNGTTGCLEFYV